MDTQICQQQQILESLIQFQVRLKVRFVWKKLRAAIVAVADGNVRKISRARGRKTLKLGQVAVEKCAFCSTN